MTLLPLTLYFPVLINWWHCWQKNKPFRDFLDWWVFWTMYASKLLTQASLGFTVLKHEWWACGVSYNSDLRWVWSVCLAGAWGEPSSSLALRWLSKIYCKPSRKDLLTVHHPGTDPPHHQVLQWSHRLGWFTPLAPGSNRSIFALRGGVGIES